MSIKSIIAELYKCYYSYYYTVFYGYLEEAVKNTLKDLNGCNDIEAIHKHIKENYI
jgi:hypothetical protein